MHATKNAAPALGGQRGVRFEEIMMCGDDNATSIVATPADTGKPSGQEIESAIETIGASIDFDTGEYIVSFGVRELRVTEHLLLAIAAEMRKLNASMTKGVIA